MKMDMRNDVSTLQAGQYWKTEKDDLEIVRVGKLVAQYRFANRHKKKSSIKVEQVSVIQDYINRNRGVLV